MTLDCSQFPTKSARDLKLSESEMTEVQKESHFQIHHTEANLTEVRKRYEFSNYLIDPNLRASRQNLGKCYEILPKHQSKESGSKPFTYFN